ncbi:MAG: SDR family oxidoreductase, partial [Chloroflexota bacterium]|nr:SDR family oxidoreductase [Chloroflexota bacterium]
MTHERDSSPHAETESAASFSLAIVGMAGRFPGAHNVDQYWQNLLGGVKSIRHFSQPELLAAGTGTQILREPNFVPAGTLLDGMDRFDAAFFGLTPREAETMDPQTRLFLQAAWETLEDAGYAPGHYPGLVGVFAGKAFPRYFTSNLLPHPDLMQRFGELQVGLGMERDTLAPLVAYKLDLKGPSVSVGTFCSTSLVAVHLACQSLLAFECDLALAGGVHLEVPQGRGYLHVDGGILSLDGECRALDARGSGSVMGNGLGVVAIKRLEDALASGDQIYAVIRGTAANNDGRDRVGFTAPGVNGQAAVIAAALANAGVEARSISYVETHGTGTALGDSVELAAMRRVFQQNTDACHFCALGSVKPNIGHLDRAAGVASLIKAALALKHRTLPPSLNYEQPNAELALEESPFCVNSELRAWPESVSGPRRAGVSSFGLGGTNAHVVLEEPPELVSSAASRTHHLLVLSARSEAALEQATDNLIDHLEAHPEQDLADVAYTLQVGRAVFPHRRMAVVRDRAEALAVLRSAPAVKQTERDTPVVFVCADSEGTRVGDLYASELVYRDAVDRCGPSQWMARASSDARTFVAEYALAELLRAWGVEPAAAEGNGVGALVAAVIEGRLALEEALPHALGEVIELGAELPHRTIADTVAAVRQVRVEITPTDLVGALDLLGQLWLGGARVDWSGFHRDEQRRRVSLPTYPFEERRFWIDPPPNVPVLTTGQHRGKKADPGEWGYAPVWTRVELPEPSPVDSRPWLIFADAAGVAASIADARAQAGLGPSLLVRHGQRFAEELDGVFTVRPNHAADYHALIRTLDERELLPGKVVHLWSLDANANSKDRFEHAQQLGFYSLISLIQSMGERAASAALELVAVSDGAQAVASDQDVRNPEQATMRGACISIAQESVTIRCRSIDLDAPSGADNVRLLLAELLADSPHLEVAYRQGVRYTLSYAPQRLERPSQPVFRQGGTYLLLGGFGGVGTVLAEHLARTASANLVLVGRSALTSEKRDIVAKLEALGGHVMVESADIADTSALRRVIQHTQEQFGALHGVFHLATISDRSAYDGVHAISRAQCQRQFGPKAQGAIALADALADLSLDLDFCVLFSSLASVLGGLSFAAYTAANIFLDAFAVGRAGWHSIDWDTWQVHPEAHVLVGGTVAEYEMAPPEGLDVLERVLAGSTSRPRTVISTGDLDARVRQWIDLESLRSPSNCSAVSGGGARPDLPTAYTPASSDVERQIAGVWRDALGIDPIGIYDNFFDLGGNSLVALQVIARLKTQLNVPIPVVALFDAPTVSALARYLQPEATAPVDDQRQMLDARRRQARGTPGDQPLAIIGMAGRFPGARDTDEFWSNLRQGVESIATFSDDELAAAGVPDTLLANPNYIKARPIIDGPDLFDAGFFGYNPREAELTDPQHRLFLECAWQSLESAGYDPKSYPGLVGVFGGTNISTYMLAMASDPDLVRSLGTYEASYQLPVGNDKDALATAVSYKLNLRGPSLTVQTFCSTSLVAVHLACQSLRRGECDLALAGGVSVRVPTRAGYLSVEGGMESPDGHCRTFDTRAQGTLFGDGLGIVVLKRLDDAVVDGDTIYGVVRGSAMNNDGSVKVGYAAPSLDGQADVIQAALEDAGVSADTIEYVEAHGTATPIGDPIEVAALTRAFRHHTSRVGTIALGSVKTNVGHLDRAAGVSGLIKTVLALHHGEIPPSLHFESPNPELDLEHSPFFVNTNLRPWARNGHPRRAGVNSLGMGGTNVHVVLEEAPDPAAAGASRPHQLLLLSARTESALEVATDNLVTFLREHPDTDLADVAYTLQVGRARFEHRRALVCEDRDGALQALGSRDGRCLLGQAQSRTERPIAFMFPGLGDQYVDMARELYEREPVFRDELDRCFSYVQNQLDLDLKAILFSRTDESKDVQPRAGGGKLDLRAMLGREGAPSALSQTAVAQPAVFVVEYALARLLMAW